MNIDASFDKLQKDFDESYDKLQKDNDASYDKLQKKIHEDIDTSCDKLEKDFSESLEAAIDAVLVDVLKLCFDVLALAFTATYFLGILLDDPIGPPLYLPSAVILTALCPLHIQHLCYRNRKRD